MGVIIGIDVGGSTTKIVGFEHTGKIIDPIFVKANDPITAIYGGFGKFLSSNSLALTSIDKVMVTGVGSSYIDKPIYSLPCEHISEFDCIGLGGLYLSGLDEAIVVSMGTGTAIVKAQKNKRVEYLGGTGVGGGTLIGLSKSIIGVNGIENIVDLAKSGNLANINLCVGDISTKTIPGMRSELTASNFGKLSDLASKNDIALGLINMIFETVAMLSLFASRDKKIKNIVMTGNMTTIPQAKEMFDNMNTIFDANFIVPDNSQFATVIGAALSEIKEETK